MNEIRRIDSEAEEIARVRAVMERFPLPDFVVGYTIELGEFDDEPAVWVRFETTHRFPESREQGMAIGKQLSDLSAGARSYLRENFPSRYPYFRFTDPGPGEKHRA